MPTTTDIYEIVKPTSGAEPADMYGVATRLADSVEAALLQHLAIPCVKATKSSAQALTSGVAAPIAAYNTFTQSSNDNDFWTYASGIYTIDEDGVFSIVGTATFAANSDATYRRIQFLINGAAGRTVTVPAVNSASIQTAIQVVEQDLALAAGATVQLQVTAGASINLASAGLTLSRRGSVLAP